MKTAGSANAKLTRLRALWDDKRKGRPMPAWQDFAIADLKSWFGHLAVIDMAPAPVFRLCGDNLVARFGCDMTRRPVADTAAEIKSEFLHSLAETRARKAPFAASACVTHHGANAVFSDLFLPLSENGTEVTMLLLASYPQRSQDARATSMND